MATEYTRTQDRPVLFRHPPFGGRAAYLEAVLLVRGHWLNADVACLNNRWLFLTDNALCRAFDADSVEELWMKGAYFTNTRLTRIGNLNDDITFVRVVRSTQKLPEGQASCDRILALLERERAQLQEGMLP